MNEPNDPQAFEQHHDLEHRRGMRICPRCHLRTLKHLEVDTRDITADRGAVVCIRTYQCTIAVCSAVVRFYEVSAGVTVSTPYQREGRSGDRARVALESAAQVELLPGRIVLKV